MPRGAPYEPLPHAMFSPTIEALTPKARRRDSRSPWREIAAPQHVLGVPARSRVKPRADPERREPVARRGTR